MKKLLLIATLTAFALPAQAGSVEFRSTSQIYNHAAISSFFSSRGWGSRGCNSAPLPLAAGLPALALMGGALVMAKRRKD